MNFIEKKKQLFKVLFPLDSFDFSEKSEDVWYFLEATVKEAVNESFRVMESTEGYTKSYLDRVRNEILKKMGL